MSDRRKAACRAWFSIARIFQSAESATLFAEAAASQGLTPRSLSVLLHVKPENPVTMSQLSEECHATPSYMSGVVDLLVEGGLVERKTPVEDRRLKLVSRTDLGDKAVAGALEQLARPPSGFDALTDEETDTLARLLEKVAAQYEWTF